jgi:hypothetical protein
MDIAEVDRTNDREWRHLLLSEIKEIKEDLKVIKSAQAESKTDSAISKLKLSLLALASGSAGGISVNSLRLLFGL